MAFRIAVLILWLLSSVGGLIYALLHFFPGRKRWAAKKWRGDPDENGARFWRLSARALLAYFLLVDGAGLIAVFWPAPPQPLRLRTAITTFALIASNLTAVWLIRLLREYGRNLRAKGVREDTIEEVLKQVTTNTGRTMRDAVDRLEVEIGKLKGAAELQTAEATELKRLVVELGEKVDRAAAAAEVIAKNLVVEADLAESHRRAEAVAHGSDAGEAADAASRMTQAEKADLAEKTELET